MNSIDLLHSTYVSYYQTKTAAHSTRMSLDDVLCAIRNGQFAKEIQNIRALSEQGEFERAKDEKGKLPAVTFSATFGDSRKGENCETYNNLLILDVDHLNNELEMQRVGGCLSEDPYVMCLWKSPSGHGWKGLVLLEYMNDLPITLCDKHRFAFIAIRDYLKEKYNIELDESGKDITRLCFMSWDPVMIIKENVESFPIILDTHREIEKQKKTTNRSSSKSNSTNQPKQEISINWQWLADRSVIVNHTNDKLLIENIYKFLKRHNKSITTTYAQWVKVAYAMANTFHPVYGKRMFLQLCAMDGVNNDVGKSEKLLFDAYSTPNKRTNFASITYLAKEAGYVL